MDHVIFRRDAIGEYHLFEGTDLDHVLFRWWMQLVCAKICEANAIDHVILEEGSWFLGSTDFTHPRYGSSIFSGGEYNWCVPIF